MVDEFANMNPLDKAFAVEYVRNGFHARAAAAAFGMDASKANVKRNDPLISRYIISIVDSYTAEARVTKQQADALLDRMQDIAFGDVQAPFVATSTGEQFYGCQVFPKLMAEVYKERRRQANALAQTDGDPFAPAVVTFQVVDKRKHD